MRRPRTSRGTTTPTGTCSRAASTSPSPMSGVPLERAAVVVLRQLSTAGPMRPGELADALAVEAPHVTRQLQKLTDVGYVKRAPGSRR